MDLKILFWICAVCLLYLCEFLTNSIQYNWMNVLLFLFLLFVFLFVYFLFFFHFSVVLESKQNFKIWPSKLTNMCNCFLRKHILDSISLLDQHTWNIAIWKLKWFLGNIVKQLHDCHITPVKAFEFRRRSNHWVSEFWEDLTEGMKLGRSQK